jgi:hypothetical protein
MDILKTGQAENEIIVGWCAKSHGGPVKDIFPDGYNSKGGEQGFDHEQWCWERVNNALAKYRDFYKRTGMQDWAVELMRDWLVSFYWDGDRMEGKWSHLVYMEIERFKLLVREEARANPMPKRVA